MWGFSWKKGDKSEKGELEGSLLYIRNPQPKKLTEILKDKEIKSKVCEAIKAYFLSKSQIFGENRESLFSIASVVLFKMIYPENFNETLQKFGDKELYVYLPSELLDKNDIVSNILLKLSFILYEKLSRLPNFKGFASNVKKGWILKIKDKMYNIYPMKKAKKGVVIYFDRKTLEDKLVPAVHLYSAMVLSAELGYNTIGNAYLNTLYQTVKGIFGGQKSVNKGSEDKILCDTIISSLEKYMGSERTLYLTASILSKTDIKGVIGGIYERLKEYKEIKQ